MSERRNALAWSVALLLLAGSSRAEAQWDTHWNESGPKPLSCLYNSQEFYVGDDVCVGAGVKQVCLADGTLGVRGRDDDCAGPEVSLPAMTRAHGNAGVACTFDESKFSAGAQVCVAPGKRQVCQIDGTLGAASSESSCKSAVVGAGG
jgi:hypothetical protein